LATTEEAAGVEVDALLWGTSKDLDVPKDSRSSSWRFLLPRAALPCEVADGGEGLGDPVLSEFLTSSPSRLSSTSGASLSKADSWGISPPSRSGGVEERKTCFYQNNTSKKIQCKYEKAKL
jgi:hypothetical protein